MEFLKQIFKRYVALYRGEFPDLNNAPELLKFFSLIVSSLFFVIHILVIFVDIALFIHMIRIGKTIISLELLSLIVIFSFFAVIFKNLTLKIYTQLRSS